MSNYTIRPGMLKHSLYLYEATKSYGNAASWAQVATNPEIRCQIQSSGGGETNGAAGDRGQRKIKVTMRFRQDVSFDKRFGDGAGRFYDIESIDNIDEMNRKLVVIAVERQNG